MTSSVLDSSAVLAWIRDEPGATTVTGLIAEGIVSTVNWSEIAQKLAQHGADAERTLSRLGALGIRVEPFTATDALTAAALWPLTQKAGLSLGDRACLALASRRQLPAVTADKAWARLGLEVDVRVIR